MEKMKKRIFLYMLFALITIIAAGCSSNNKSSNSGASPSITQSSADSFTSSAASYETSYDDTAEAEYGYVLPEEKAVETLSGSGLAANGQNLMFIKTANINLRTDNFDNDLISIRSTVTQHGGYFESSNLYTSSSGQDTYKRYNATIRVPVENYEIAKQALEGIGTLYGSNESSKEVSGEYFNIKSRLDTSKSEEKRLLELINETYDMKQLIQLEQRLGEVRTQIELYEAQLIRIESLTSYSTIVVDVTEVKTEELIVKDDSFFTRLGDGFKNSVDATISFFQNVLVFLAYIIVPLVIIAILMFVGIAVFKRFRKKSE